METFTSPLAVLQPSQLYICSEKLAQVMADRGASEGDRFGPLPVKKLGGKVVLTDGHTRAFAAFKSGLHKIEVYWDTDELDWEAYEICVAWCLHEGIESIADLEDRVVGEHEYEKLWHRRCRKMHRELAEKRAGTDAAPSG